MGSPETTEGGQRRRRCRQCCERMDVRARVCPHCHRRNFQTNPRGELIRLGLVLGLVLTSSLWFRPFLGVCTWASQLYFGRFMGPALVRSLQAAHPPPAAAHAAHPVTRAAGHRSAPPRHSRETP